MFEVSPEHCKTRRFWGYETSALRHVTDFPLCTGNVFETPCSHCLLPGPSILICCEMASQLSLQMDECTTIPASRWEKRPMLTSVWGLVGMVFKFFCVGSKCVARLTELLVVSQICIFSLRVLCDRDGFILRVCVGNTDPCNCF